MKDTEQSIIEAAILIFNEDLSAPLEKVADQAQVTRRTLHRYFKDRKELMDKCHKEIRKGLRNSDVQCLLCLGKSSGKAGNDVLCRSGLRFEKHFFA